VVLVALGAEMGLGEGEVEELELTSAQPFTRGGEMELNMGESGLGLTLGGQIEKGEADEGTGEDAEEALGVSSVVSV